MKFIDLIDNYYCVFIGDPKGCLPSGIFSSEKEAKYYHIHINSLYIVMTVKEWNKLYVGTKD